MTVDQGPSKKRKTREEREWEWETFIATADAADRQ